MKAKQAREISVKAKSSGMTYQVRSVLDSIRRRASNGETYLILDDPRICLFEDDIKTLERMGYSVLRPEIEGALHYITRIDW